METFFDQLFRRLQQVIIARPEPFPINRPIDAIRPVAATGQYGGPSVQDLESFQVEFGRNRRGDIIGGWATNPQEEQLSRLPFFGDETPVERLARESVSSNPGFVSSPVQGGYQPATPRNAGGATPVSEGMRGGFNVPEASRNQV